MARVVEAGWQDRRACCRLRNCLRSHSAFSQTMVVLNMHHDMKVPDHEQLVMKVCQSRRRLKVRRTCLVIRFPLLGNTAISSRVDKDGDAAAAAAAAATSRPHTLMLPGERPRVGRESGFEHDLTSTFLPCPSPSKEGFHESATRRVNPWCSIELSPRFFFV